MPSGVRYTLGWSEVMSPTWSFDWSMGANIMATHVKHKWPDQTTYP
jgi:hypothetical protein